jgi:hypothetical protein
LFESEERLASEVSRLLDGLREAAGARYACVVDRSAVLFQSLEAEDEPAAWMVRQFLEPLIPALFSIPDSLAGDGPPSDVFEGWEHDDFLLAILNTRTALVLACPDADAARTAVEPGFRLLADLLLRYKPAFRLDDQGGGVFFGRPRVDWIVAARER